jgi:integrase
VVHGYLLPWFGERPLESITHRDVISYRDELKRKGRALRKMPTGEKEREGKLSNRTIVRHLIVCHSVFKRARQVWDHLPPNPAAADLVERPPVVYDGSFDVLDPDEVLAPFTGLREGECFALRWRHIDFAVGRLRVEENWTDKRLKMTKGKKARSVPMTDEVMAMLDGLSRRGYLDAPDDLVFPAPGGGHLDDMAVRRQWYKDLKAAKVRRVRFHDLRHTFGTQAVQKLPVTDVQAIMGHAHISTTQRYIHYKPGHEEGAKLGEAFSAQRVSRDVSRTATIPA